MTQLGQVTIAMLLFGLGVFSLGLWAAKKYDSVNPPTGAEKK